MARARNIKPGFFRNADLVELSFEARLLFIGLWTIADKAGRLEDRPKQIKMELFPADNMDCNDLIETLAVSGFVARYEVDGKRYLQVVNFTKHQNPHRDEKASTIPSIVGNDAYQEQAQDEHRASTVQAPRKEDADSVAIGLIPDSLNLIPDSLNLTPETVRAPERVNNSTTGTPAGSVCSRLKSECRITDVNPQHPKLLALLAAGLTADEIVAAGMDSKVKTFAYVLSAAEGRRRDASNIKPLPAKSVGGLSRAGQSTADAAARWLESEGLQA